MHNHEVMIRTYNRIYGTILLDAILSTAQEQMSNFSQTVTYRKPTDTVVSSKAVFSSNNVSVLQAMLNLVRFKTC